jgi:hypothetical protein
MWDRRHGWIAEQYLHDADAEDCVERRDESVRGKREQKARLADPAKISECEHEDARERKRDLVRGEGREDRGDRKDAGRDRDGYRQDVVGQ